MNTIKEIQIEEFKKILTETIASLKAGNSITINYNGDDTITCFSKGQKLFVAKKVDGASALEAQLFLTDKNFYFNKYKISPYAYEAVYKKPHPLTR